MIMKKAFILAAALAALLAILQGCCPKFYPHTTENTERIVTVTETVRDTVIQVRPDSSIVQALIRCDSTGRAKLEEIQTLRQSERLRQTISLQDNHLTAKATVDSMGIYLTYKDRYREEQNVQTIETVIEKEINVLRWWQKALMWAGVISTILLLGLIVAKFISIKLR